MARIESQQLADLQGMKNLLDGIETQLKSIIGMAKSGIPKTATSSKDIDETVKKTNEAKQAFNGLTEAQKQNIIVTQDLNKAKKQFKDQLLAEESAYKKLVNEYGIALQKGKDLAATYGLLDDRTKKATAAALALNNRLKEIDSSMGNNQRKVGDYAGALGSLKDKMLAIGGAAIAAMGISSIGSAITSGIKKAIAYEEELERLKFATEGTTVSFDNLSKFAKEMGGKSLFSTLDILNAEQMAVALGRDEEQTKNMVTAAMGLSRVTGVDLQTAMTQLNMTFSGSVGRLAKYAPEMKNLTEEQLKSGMAVDILAEKMGRFATSVLDTTAGKMKMFEKTWGAIQRAMGDVALKVIVPLIDGLKKVADWIKSNTGAFLTIAKVIAVAGSAILTYTLISNASMIAEKVWTSVKLAWAAAVKAAQVAQTSFNNAAKSNPYGLIAAAIAAVIVAVIAFKDTMTEAQKAQESFKKSMDEEIGASNSLFEQLKKTNVGTKERTDLIVQINEKYGQYLGNIDLEKAGLNEIEAAQNNVNNGLINNILLKEKANTLAAFYAEQAHILVELQKKGLTQKDINDQRDVKNNTWIYQADKEAQSMIESYIKLDWWIKETSDLYDATAEEYRKSFASNNSNPVVKEVKKDSKTAKDKIDKEAEDYEAKIK
ncbi:MAG: hypothetical protein NTW06_03860, partial [Candidatus Falkowbacteria bacterium]|nr:hypothetical protein [Candidatus Falkowbacteria bacterium]